MDYSAIIQRAAVYVAAYITERDAGIYCFHDMKHVNDVVEATELMAAHYKLSEKDRFIAVVAAYFHDVGYFNGGAADHEKRSAEIAADYLAKEGVDPATIDAVKGCILATRMPQHPSNLLEEIVCDADLFHLGTDNFMERNDLMQREALNHRGNKGECWPVRTLNLLENHHYHTDYARERLEDLKMQHADLLRSQLNADQAQPSDSLAEVLPDKPKKKKKENSRPDRGIETMFRVTSTNNQRLSDMADNKANILLTVNSIILSVVIALLLRKLGDSEHLTIPTFMLLSVSMTTIVVAILATRPKIPSGTFTSEDVANKSVNLLFFGNFYKMGLDAYADGMKKIMDDRDFLYGTLTRDVYSQGVVLGRKYRLLRLAYNIFMFGLVVTVIAFLVASIWYDVLD